MKNKFSVLLTTVLATGAVATIAATPAHAAVLSCSNSISGNVTGTTACEYSTTENQDFLNKNPMTVNAEGFFGISDWVFGGKIDVDSGYTGVGEGQSGNWDISSVVQSNWNNVMLIFKSGNNTTLTGYKVQNGVTLGTWASPFTKDVSHISVYYTTGVTNPPQTTPEPATILGLGLVASGMVIARRLNLAN